jgi:L-alanine-DL-glutamate epimerase-like enolase superfamily enzyme
VGSGKESALKISAVRSWQESVALLKPYEIASMRIDSVELIFVQIQTDQGAYGLGSASPAEDVTGERPDDCAAALSDNNLRWLVGSDPRLLDDIGLQLQESHPDTPAARAAVDMALFDLIARKHGVPLVDVLGRCHEALPTSVTVGISSVEESIADAGQYIGNGFRCLKVKTGRSFEEDRERLQKLRERFGPEIRIRIDGNEGCTVDETCQLGALAEELDLELIEQPLPARAIDEMRSLPLGVRRIIAADESLRDVTHARELAIEPAACGIFNIKLMKCGGILPARAIAHVARNAGIDLMWGCNDESVVSITAALHAAYACPHTRYLDLDGSFDLSRDPFKGGFTIDDGGCLRPLDQPGLGVELIDD